MDQRDAKLRRRIGSLFVVGTPGTNTDEIPSLYKEVVRKGWVGGFIAYGYNVQNADQIASLNKALEQLSPHNLLRMVDLEGGHVNRLQNWVQLNAPKDLGDHISAGRMEPEALRKIFENVALQVKAAGLNVNLAPVVDLHNDACPVIGKLRRAFSSDPAIAVDCSLNFIKAFSRHGVLPCLKHFPGHGTSREDTHVGCADVTETASDAELGVYDKIIKADTGCKFGVMTCHVVNRKLDKTGSPATFSRPIIMGLLRERLVFKGLVISDSMDMNAIAKHHSPTEAAIRALKAGNDILIYSCNSSASKPSNTIIAQGDAKALEGFLGVLDNIVEASKIDNDLVVAINRAISNRDAVFRTTGIGSCSAHDTSRVSSRTKTWHRNDV